MATAQQDLELTFIGTATVLLRYAGFTILTDPNFLHAGDHAYLGLGLRSRRLTDPAMALDALPPPVMGSMLDFTDPEGQGLRLYISGDTLLHDRIEEVPRRFPDIDVCLIHLGGTRVAGILLTMDADQGVRFLQVVRPATAVPIHFDDYTVFKSPLADFEAAADRAGLETEIRYVAHGDTITIPVAADRRRTDGGQ